MRINAWAVFILVALCGGLSGAAAQAPAPAPSSANLTSPLDQILSSPTFGFLHCYDRLEWIYAEYQNYTDWTKIPAEKFNTSLGYVACQELLPDYTAELVVYNPILLKGTPVAKLAEKAPLVSGAILAIDAAAKAVQADGELFVTSPYPWNTGGIPPATLLKTSMGRVIAGLGAEANKWFTCICGVTQQPINTA